MWEMIQPYLLEILVTIFTAIATYIGSKIKEKYEEHINTETKEKVVKTVVNAIEQLYKDLSGEEKLEKAKENILELLNEKGLTMTELEMNMMIEEVVNGFNQGIKKGSEE